LELKGKKKIFLVLGGWDKGPNGTGKARFIDFMRMQTNGKEKKLKMTLIVSRCYSQHILTNVFYGEILFVF
jgi:hypothetical protein